MTAAAIHSASLGATCSGEWASLEPACGRRYTGPQDELAAGLVTIAWYESGFVARIQEGRCLPLECDPMRLRGGRVHHRARGYWQLHTGPLVPPETWRRLVGLDYHTVTRAAYAAATVLGDGLRRCGSRSGALAYYAGLPRCRWSGARERLATWDRVLRRLRAMPTS